MIHQSLETFWLEFCNKECRDPSSTPSDEFVHVFEHFVKIIQEKDKKIERAEKCMETYKVHNHSHLQTKLALAGENYRLKEELDLERKKAGKK